MPPKNLRPLFELLTHRARPPGLSGRSFSTSPSYGRVAEGTGKMTSVWFLVARVAGGTTGYGIAYWLFDPTTKKIERAQMPYMPKKNAKGGKDS